jgi:NAD(P)-dependent dehydrogenase (short-subunit alcohol dehydrogenase family)
MSFSLSGNVALVTGDSTGMGTAIAIGLAKFGTDIAVTSHKLPDSRRWLSK